MNQLSAPSRSLASFDITPVDRKLEPALQAKIDQKAKPQGALGQLERLAMQIALVQQRLDPVLTHPTIVVCAADHGINAEGVSAYPSEVTAQMVLNFVAGGGAINVLAAQHGISLTVVDAGVAGELPANARLRVNKIRSGTRNFAHEPAMTVAELELALGAGSEIVTELHAEGCNVVGFGDMGIGNTSSAAMLMAFFCDLPLSACVGAGAGLDAQGVRQKLDVLSRAYARVSTALAEAQAETPAHWGTRVLAESGGFELVLMLGGMLRAAELNMLVLVDGFIATASVLAGLSVHPNLRDFCIFAHCSAEAGHRAMLASIQATPLLDLEMRLGEGSGAAIAYPLLCSATGFLNEMASFESAGVSGRTDGA